MNNDSIALKRSLFYQKTDLEIANEQCMQLTTIKDELFAQYRQEVKELSEYFFKKSGASVFPLTSHGTFNLIYKVSFSEHERYIVKVMLPKLPLPETAFLIDAWVYGVLEEKGLPSLNVYKVDMTQTFVSFNYEIIEFVKGHPLSVLQDPDTQSMPNGILSSLGALVAQVHAHPLHGFGPLSIMEYRKKTIVQGVHRFWSDYIFCHLNKHIDICLNIGALSFMEVEEIKNIFMKYTSLFDCDQGVLLHGDLGGHNIFSDGARITALIDWEDCMSGDPIFDLAYWGTFMQDHLRNEFMSGYKKHAPIPPDFELRYWLYYLRIALSKTVHRYRFGYLDRPNRPAASTRIQKALMYLHNLGE